MTLTPEQAEAIRSTRELWEEWEAGLPEVRDSLRSAYLRSVEDARAAGATNQEIGDVLGVSRQRVSQLLKKEER